MLDCRVPMTASGDMMLSINVGTSSCILRPPDGQPHEPVREIPEPVSDLLEKCLRAEFEPRRDLGFLKTTLELSADEPDNWLKIADWFEGSRHVYCRAVRLAEEKAPA